jgi:hypothetical protein
VRTLKKKATFAVALIVVALAALVKFDFIKDEGGGGYFLWKNDQAFLFMFDRPIGYRLSVIRYLAEPILALFHAVAFSADDTSILTIVRITPAGTERSEQEPTVGFYDITPVDNQIYTRCPGGICELSGMRFQILSEKNEEKVEGNLSRKDFEDINGWSRRSLIGTHVGEESAPYEFSISLSNGDKLLVRGGNPVSVDLLRQNRPSERVWYHEQHTRRVSRAEYDRIFHRH